MLEHVLILLLSVYAGIVTFVAFRQKKFNLLKFNSKPKLKAPEWDEKTWADLVIKQ